MTGKAAELLGPTRIVLTDANVLYTRVLRDYLVYAADKGAISIRWSRAILIEAVTHLQANNSTFDDEQGDLLIRLLNDAYPEAEIEPTASARRKVKSLDMPDEDDRHVLTAAVTAHADIVCTNNVKDFPPETMASVGSSCSQQTRLLSRLVTMYPSRMRDAHRTAVASLTGATDTSTIAALRRAKATQTADLMEALLKRS